jgi:prephenate dehydrogenase
MPDAPIQNVTMIGTGLIGASIGLALRANGFAGKIIGIDASGSELETAERMGAITDAARSPEAHAEALRNAHAVVFAVPVLAILDWMERVRPHVAPGTLLTDTGSTKAQIAARATSLFPQQFLPGHPMAGKESGGAALAEASLFQNAPWIFTPLHPTTPREEEWRTLVAGFGARLIDLEPERHDTLCAWVSHLPQMVATAMTAVLEDQIGDDEQLRAIGGRALREMTRLGASPYSMWRDIAMTNEKPIADTLLALEQRLQHMRENLRTPELREEFQKANAFRNRKS